MTFPVAPTKDPGATLDYVWDWHTTIDPYLEDGESIVSHVTTAEPGITIAASIGSLTYVTVWLAGGTDRVSYNVTNRVTTSMGRTDERTYTIPVANR